MLVVKSVPVKRQKPVVTCQQTKIVSVGFLFFFVDAAFKDAASQSEVLLYECHPDRSQIV